MEQLLIILHQDDIPVAQQVAASLPAYQSLTFDPVLLDRIIAAGLQGAQLISWDNCPLYAALEGWAHQTAFEMEADIARAINNVVPRVSVVSWQHASLVHLLLAAKWHSVMWRANKQHFQGNRLHIFIVNQPVSHDFHSFVPATTLVHYASEQAIELLAYQYGEKPANTDLVPALRGVREPNEADEILVHLPGCGQDIDYFNRELGASGKTILNLQAKYFNLAVAHHEQFGLGTMEELLPALPEAWRAALPALREQLLPCLDGLFKAHIPVNHYRLLQAGQMADLYLAQLLSLGLLNQYFSLKKPSRLLLSDHDGDFHGPLLAFAEQHHVPVLYLAHAKTTPDICSRYKNITCLSHPIQGDVILAPDGRSVPNPKLNFPEHSQFSTGHIAPIKQVAIVLPRFSPAGIYSTRYAVYMDGVKRMVAWCRKHDLAFALRCNLAAPMMKLLAEATGMDAASLIETAKLPLADYAQQSDLCFMYDAPDAAGLEFLRRGIALLNPVPKPLVNSEGAGCNPAVVPRENMDEILRVATMLLQDPLSLEAFRRKQYLAYMNLFGPAQALRVFL